MKRKIINKPNDPSALRLEEMNKTIDKLEENSTKFLQ